MDLPVDAPKPRMCHLIKWPDFDGYGFNLHAEKSKSGQFIGKVDDDSPAMFAGLREGDKIIEVNGVNIANENHRQVVERIKAVGNETKLLVVDESAEKWYKERKLTVKSSQPNVLFMKTPVPRPAAREEPVTVNGAVEVNNDINVNVNEKNEDEKVSEVNAVNEKVSEVNAVNEKVSEVNAVNENEVNVVNTNLINNNNNDEKCIEETASQDLKEKSENSSAHSTPQSVPKRNGVTPELKRPPSVESQTNSNKTDSIPGSPGSTKSSATSKDGTDLNLNMSASEMRQMLAQRKKHDPKKAQIDLRQKYEIIQQM